MLLNTKHKNISRFSKTFCCSSCKLKKNAVCGRMQETCNIATSYNKHSHIKNELESIKWKFFFV